MSTGDSAEFLSRYNEASARLLIALDPQTDEEKRLALWLTNWDTATLNTIATMVERQLTQPQRKETHVQGKARSGDDPGPA